jgi:hypothetical protein
VIVIRGIQPPPTTSLQQFHFIPSF